ncbi:MAG: HEAT repeat domain-containing protein [Sulfuricella sp.]
MIFPPLSNADPLAAVAFWVGAASVLLTGMLMLSILLRRLVQGVKQQWRKRALNRWRPLLMASLYEHPESLPPLSRFDLPDFLALWNHLHASLGNEARGSLNRVAGALRVPAAVSLMLRQRNFERRLLAVRTAGNLRLATAWDALCDLLENDSPGMSLAAAQALVRIDAPRAGPLLISHLIERDDWPPQRVTEILREAETEQVTDLLVKAIEEVSPEQAPRLIRYLTEIAPTEAAPIIARQLASPADDALLSVSLQALNHGNELESVRMLCRHANWHVRVHAATALGRFGTCDDKTLLTGMLGDSQWWVRYRAARALSLLPGMTIGELLRIKDMQTVRYARDMLHQVMAELDLQAGLHV